MAVGVTERWTYIGRRPGAKTKTVHCWIDESGRELAYAKVSGHVVGAVYEMNVERSDASTRASRGRFLENLPDDPRMAEWVAADRAHGAVIESERAEKRAAADNELQDALDVVCRHFAALRNWTQKGAFLNYVLGEAQRPPRKRVGDE